MATQGLRWSPDTCACQFEFQWDDAEYGAGGTAVFADAVKTLKEAKPCPQHVALSGAALQGVVWSENKNKNRALAVVQSALGIGPEAVLWYYDVVRNLHLVIPGLTTALKTALNTALAAADSADADLDASKIKVD